MPAGAADRASARCSRFPRLCRFEARIRLRGAAPRAGNGRPEGADVRQAAEPPIVVEAKADDEFVADIESDPMGACGSRSAAALAHKDTDAHGAGAEREEAGPGGREGDARIENVIDEEDVGAAEIPRRGAYAMDGAGAAGGFPDVAAEPPALEPERHREMAGQVGEEEERSVEDAEQDEVAAAVAGGDLAREAGGAAADRTRGDQDGAGRELGEGCRHGEPPGRR